MKIAYKHLINFIPSSSLLMKFLKSFFNWGHEHEIQNDIFEMELTPNRGDCLSINGLLRDLAVFYEIIPSDEIYRNKINRLNINFINKAQKSMPIHFFPKNRYRGRNKNISRFIKRIF